MSNKRKRITFIQEAIKYIAYQMANIFFRKLREYNKVHKHKSKRDDLYDMYYSGDISIAELQKLENDIFKAHKDKVITKQTLEEYKKKADQDRFLKLIEDYRLKLKKEQNHE